jgi:hypothetical protein
MLETDLVHFDTFDEMLEKDHIQNLSLPPHTKSYLRRCEFSEDMGNDSSRNGTIHLSVLPVHHSHSLCISFTSHGRGIPSSSP